MPGEEGEGSVNPALLDFAGFAQEFLRRSPAYRRDYAAAAANGYEATMAARWGLLAPVAPERTAAEAPALWAPTACAWVVTIEDDHLSLARRGAHLPPKVRTDRQLAGGRYLILDDAGTLHRLWLRRQRRARPPAYIIARGAGANLRFAAARRLEHYLAGAPLRLRAGRDRPTAFQARRLTLFLAILDAIAAEAGAPATSYEIGHRLIYPALRVRGGAEWKSSSERRQTQRLIDEAREWMNGGYRRLLMGQTAGATKRRG
jgi:hypothetical protein